MEVPELNTTLIEAYRDLDRTMTDLVQTIEAASPEENQPRPQTSHDHTEPSPVEATTDTSPKADMAPTLQTSHDHTPPLPPLVIMEQFAQTDTTSLPRTTQVATQTRPPLWDYRAELKAEIARTER